MTTVVSKKLNTRAIACKILEKVIKEGKSFHPQLIASSFKHLSTQDLGFVSHLCFGTLRYYPRLEEWLKTLLRHPLKEQDTDVKILLALGLYQLFYSDTPPYAAMNETVEAAFQINKKWAKALINGVLRQAQRSKDKLHDINHICNKTATPEWLVKRLQKAWGAQHEAICEAQLAHPPFSLRINHSKTTRENYIKLLSDKELVASVIEYCPQGFILETPCAVDELPQFQEGVVSVQDGAAQLAAHLLDVKQKQRILDACAAPGGKTAHLLEIEPTLQVTALDKDESRCALLQATLKRTGCPVKVQCTDAADTNAWWDGELFDRILLDAPCSATGIIRRHPDIKLHRRHSDLPLLVRQQKTLLDKLWLLLKPNGILLYATCSVLPEENVEVIEQFLQTHPDAKELPIMEDWGITQKVGRQILPGQHQMDGFYYARLTKHA